jgi:hypothetical protein
LLLFIKPSYLKVKATFKISQVEPIFGILILLRNVIAKAFLGTQKVCIPTVPPVTCCASHYANMLIDIKLRVQKERNHNKRVHFQPPCISLCASQIHNGRRFFFHPSRDELIRNHTVWTAEASD